MDLEGRHKLILGLALSATLSGFSTLAPGAQATGFTDILRGMATGLALLGQSSNTGGLPYAGGANPFYPMPPGMTWPPASASPGWGGSPWMGSPWAGGPWGGQPPWSGMSPYNSAPYERSYEGEREASRILERLQGSWKTDKGGLLLVRRDMARLYMNRNEHQDFYLRGGRRYVWMWPVKSQASQRYEYHISSDRILLRDEFGNTLTLIRYQPGQSNPEDLPPRLSR